MDSYNGYTYDNLANAINYVKDPTVKFFTLSGDDRFKPGLELLMPDVGAFKVVGMSLLPASDPWYIELLWSLLRPLKIVPFFWKPYAIHLDKLDEHILRQIVQKFEFGTGTRFYRSCRGAKDFVDRAKTAWTFPTAVLYYREKRRDLIYEEDKQKFKMPNFCADKLCRIDLIHIHNYDPNFFEETLLPEVAALGAVGMIYLRGATLPDEDIRRLLAAAKPAIVGIEHRYFDPEADVFKHVKNLAITRTDVGPYYYATRKLFELARNRKSFRLVCSNFNKDVVTNFVENWLKGEPTGSLERLAIVQCYDASWSTEDKVKHEDDICDFMNSFCQSPGDYILKRGGLDRLEITCTFDHSDVLSVAFRFS